MKQNSRALSCPTSPNQPKSQILFHNKSPPKDFVRETLAAAALLSDDVRHGVWQFN